MRKDEEGEGERGGVKDVWGEMKPREKGLCGSKVLQKSSMRLGASKILSAVLGYFLTAFLAEVELGVGRL